MGSMALQPLPSSTPLTPDETCPEGVLIEADDENQDGLLEPEEIISSQAVCNGVDAPFIQWVSEAYLPDEVCPEGGIRTYAWQDIDENGIFDPGFDLLSKKVCSAMEHPAKLDSTRWSPRRSLPGDPECPNGGFMVLGGRDLNRDGILDPEETTMSQLICNGSDALTTLSQVLPPSPNPEVCPAGGTELQLGLDLNDGILDPEEVQTSTTLCTAETPPTSLIETFAIPPGVYLPSPDINRGAAGTAVAEGRDRQLVEISTTPDVFKFLIRLGYNANGHAVTLAIPESGPLQQFSIDPSQSPTEVSLSTYNLAGLNGEDIQSAASYIGFETPDYDRLYVLTTGGELKAFELHLSDATNETSLTNNADLRELSTFAATGSSRRDFKSAFFWRPRFQSFARCGHRKQLGRCCARCSVWGR